MRYDQILLRMKSQHEIHPTVVNVTVRRIGTSFRHMRILDLFKSGKNRLDPKPTPESVSTAFAGLDYE